MDISPTVAREPTTSIAVPIFRGNSPVEADVVMQDEVINKEQVIQQDAVIKQKEIFQDIFDEPMQDMVEGRDKNIDESNLDPIVESTIGTESPLFERMRQRRLRGATSDAQVDRDLTNNMTLESHLRKFEVSMEDDHATTVRWLLHDARRASTSISRFADDGSPFASAQSVLWVPGTPILPGDTKVRIESHVSHLLSYAFL